MWNQRRAEPATSVLDFCIVYSFLIKLHIFDLRALTSVHGGGPQEPEYL